MAKLVNGQKIFLRSGKDIIETTVAKVGRKYFELAAACSR